MNSCEFLEKLQAECAADPGLLTLSVIRGA